MFSCTVLRSLISWHYGVIGTFLSVAQDACGSPDDCTISVAAPRKTIASVVYLRVCGISLHVTPPTND